MDPWQLFILVFFVVLPLALLGTRRRWADDRLTFRGRPTERDWNRQVHPPSPDDDHH